jgi:hypothetical protein
MDNGRTTEDKTMTTKISLNNLAADVDTILNTCYRLGVPVNCYASGIDADDEDIDRDLADAIAREDTSLLYIWSSDAGEAIDRASMSDEDDMRDAAELLGLA